MANQKNNKQDEDWNEIFKQASESVSDETLLTIVDCHIKKMKNNNTTIDPNTIAWELNNAKRLNDLKIYNSLKHDFLKKKHITCLSFPSKKWIFEKGMAQSFESGCTFTFNGLERNANVLNESVYVKKRKTIGNATYKYDKLNPISANNYFKNYNNKNKKYDFIYLDWMGTWSREKKIEVESMFTSNILNNLSYFAFTIMLFRGRPETYEELESVIETSHSVTYDFNSDKYSDHKLFKLKTQGLSILLEDIANKYGYSMQLKMFSLYSGGTKKKIIPELSFVFKITKLDNNK